MLKSKLNELALCYLSMAESYNKLAHEAITLNLAEFYNCRAQMCITFVNDLLLILEEKGNENE